MRISFITALAAVFLSLCGHLSAAEDQQPSASNTLGPYVFIDALYATERIEQNGTFVEQEIIKRYILKDANVITLGETAFLSGLTLKDDRIKVEGAHWDSITIPLANVRAMATMTDVRDAAQRGEPTKHKIGNKIINIR